MPPGDRGEVEVGDGEVEEGGKECVGGSLSIFTTNELVSSLNLSLYIYSPFSLSSCL